MGTDKNQNKTEGFIIGAIFGATVSAIAALLFAPKSGKDLRKDIGEGTDEYLELARKKGTEVMHEVEDAADAAVSYFSLAGDKVEETLSKTKGIFSQKKEEAKDMAEETTEEVKDVAAEATDEVKDATEEVTDEVAEKEKTVEEIVNETVDEIVEELADKNKK